jgi:hypothetical protein
MGLLWQVDYAHHGCNPDVCFHLVASSFMPFKRGAGAYLRNIEGVFMRVIAIIGLLFCLMVPSAFAGLVRLDIDDLECIDWDTGSIGLGGNLSFLIDESVADSNTHTGLGFYQGALAGGHFWNARTGKSYSLDLVAQNHVQVKTDSVFYTGIELRGSFKDDQGNSRFFDLWMEASYKADDYLHNLKSNVIVWENTVIFNLFEPQDHFEGTAPRTVKFSPVSRVPEPAPWLLLLMGVGALVLRTKRSTPAI